MNRRSAKLASLLVTVPVLSTALALLVAQPTVQAQSTNPDTAAEPYVPEQDYDEYMRLGYAAEQNGNYIDAATYFRYALYAVPNDREATIAYWNVYNALQDVELTGTAAAYDRAMEAGYDATDSGDYDTALSYFEQALQLRPNDYYATQALRNVYTYLNRGVNADSPTDVSPTYTVYVGETPYDRYMRLGYAAVQREDLASAQAYFRSALYERPNDRQATVAYWNAIDGLQDGDYGLDNSPEVSSESAYDRFMRLGYDATQRGNYTQALNFFERALAERPDDGYATQAIRNVQTYMNGAS